MPSPFYKISNICLGPVCRSNVLCTHGIDNKRSILRIKIIRIVPSALRVLHFSDGFLPLLGSVFLEYNSAYVKRNPG